MAGSMELRHLRYFVAVAETGSLSQAAEKLFIAQPPLSVQIRQLEEAVGAPLFTRHPRGVRLTAAGAALLPEARDLLARAGRLQSFGNAAQQALSLSLGFVPSASTTVLPDLVRPLRRAHPQLQLQLKEMITSEQVHAIVAGQIDAGLARTPARHPRLTVACELADPFCLVLPADHRRTGTGPVNLRDFAEADFVAFTRHRGPAYFDQSVYLCSQAGFSPRIRYEASTVHGVLDLVGAGLGVALIPASTSLLAQDGVRLRSLQRHAGRETLALVRRKEGGVLLAEVETLVAAIFATLQQRIAARLAAS